MSPTKKLATVIGAVFVIVLFVAPIAAAHHPAITAMMDCNGNVTYTVTAWDDPNATSDPSARAFTGVKVYSGSTLIGTGNFSSADNYSFSGSFTVGSNVNSVTVTAQTDGTWGDGYSGVDQTSDTATRPTNCPKSPTIATVLSSSSVTVGSTVHDTSTLTGASSHPTGTISYKLYSDNHCGTQIADLTPASDAISSSTLPDSKLYTSDTVGTFYFVATYSGDDNNTGPITSGCTAEPFVVSKAQTATTTAIKQGASTVTSISNGTSVSDVATVSGKVGNIAPTGTVAFLFYSTIDCSGTSTSAGSPALASGSATSNAEGPLSAGSYSFKAIYSGDANYTVSTGTCEPLTVNAPPPTPTPSNPAISITKNPKSQTIASGATANFTITVTNTGNITLTSVTVSDAQAPGCNAALGTMTPGATATYSCSLANVTSGFTNSATVTGTPPSGPNVTATDTAPVTVTTPPPPVATHPAITLTKGPASQTIGIGGTATFTITVTNSGDVTLTDVTVTDPSSPDCNRALGTLTAGQSKSYTCIRGHVSANFQNIANVTGKPPTGEAVKASDHATVKVKAFVPPQSPRIAIVKSPKSQLLTTDVRKTTNGDGSTTSAVRYGTATFKIKVTNTGNVALHGVTVSDPLSPACTHRIGNLPTGASRTYTCSRAAVSSSFLNVAKVTGISPKGKHVSDTDHARVIVKLKTTSVGGVSTNPGGNGTTTGVRTTGSGSPQFTG